jgi:pyrroloquinoline-quinone synthase
MTQDTPATPALITALDQLIERHHLLKHPFYQAWSEGTLSRETLALYAEQYYQHVKAFPRNLLRLAARCDGQLENLVAENVAEELDPAAPHPQLWRQFALSVGATNERLDSAQPLPGVAKLLGEFREVSEKGPLANAVAAFYVYEAQVPEISGEKIAGLRKFYGITTPEGLAYFQVHQEADLRHRQAWRDWLAQEADNLDHAEILAGAERILTGLWGVLDAVYPEGCACHGKN